MNQVQQLRQHFEKLKVSENELIEVEKVSPKNGLFKRSKTSLEIIRNCDKNENHDNSDNYLLNKCLKRSPAFRFNQDKTRASLHITGTKTPVEHRKLTQQKSANNNPKHQDEVEYLSTSETIKRALSKPLPIGLPPKKPPRIFNNNNNVASMNETSTTTTANSSFTTPNKEKRLNDEVIYMEPFAHLRQSPSPSPATTPIKEQEPLHYMCTDLDIGHSSRVKIAPAQYAAVSLNDSFEKSSIEKINLLFDVIYDEKRRETVIGETRDLLNEIETKKSPKVSRSLTEKRKEYVRKVSDIRMKPRRSFDTEITLKSSSIEYKPSALINKFQSYINIKNPNSNIQNEIRSDENGNLFDMLLLIGFDASKSSSYIKMCYPTSAKPPSSITQLIYPNQRVILELLRKQNQNLCLILTNEYGNQFYAYCRQLLPEGSDKCLPLAYCIISKTKATGFYFQILSEIESRHGLPKQQHMKLIQEIYVQNLPKNGETLQFFVETDKNSHVGPMVNRRQSMEGNEKVLILRPTDSRQECDEYSILYENTSRKLLMLIFGSLLIERKVILISNDISKMSMTILAFTSILYPFEWQYPVISLITDNIIDLLESPFPILAGVLKSSVIASSLNVEDGIVIDLDDKDIWQKCGDEETLIPTGLKKSILLSLKVIDAVKDKKKIMNVLIAEAFLKFFVKIFSNIDAKNFKKEIFIKAQKAHDPSIEFFLDWFLDTAMFKTFIRKSNEDGNFFKVFKTKVLEKSTTLSHAQRERQLEIMLKNIKYSTTKRKTFAEKIKEFLT